MPVRRQSGSTGRATSVRLPEHLRLRLARHLGRLRAETGETLTMADAVAHLLRHYESTSGSTASSPGATPRAAPTVTPVHHGTDRPTGSQRVHTTQRVTAADLARNQIRVPRATKELLPQEPSEVAVLLNGVTVTTQWNPRVGPDRERSGVLRFKRAELIGVPENAVLQVQRIEGVSLSLAPRRDARSLDDSAAGEISLFLAGKVKAKRAGGFVIPPIVNELVESGLASPDVHEQIPYLNDDWIKVAGFRRSSMDVSANGAVIVPAVIKDLIRLGLRLRGIDRADF